MLLLNLLLFVGLFIGLVFGLEYVLPPFGKLYYTGVLEILTSFATDMSIKFDTSFNIAFILIVIILSIVPICITVFINLSFRKKKRPYGKYRLK